MSAARPFTVLAALLALAAGAWLLGHNAATGVVRAAAVVGEPIPPAGLTLTAARTAAAPADAAALRPSGTEPLSARVDRLSRSGDPVDAFAAYRLVTDCLWARDHADWLVSHVAAADRALLPTAAAACGDIASDQVQARLRWLERAADAGVHHAATALAREGPEGLGLLPDQQQAPQFAGWRARVEAAYDAGVRTCDPDSLGHRLGDFEQGADADRAKALTYWVAYVDCRRRLEGPTIALGRGPGGIAQRLGGTLEPDEFAAAVAAGHRLASTARPLPGDS